MGRGRKKKRELKITTKDRKLLQAIAKTGRTTKDLAKKYYKTKEKRLYRLVKENILEKEPFIDKNKGTYCYRLTTKGKRWVKQNLANVNILYKPSNMGAKHDIKLFEKFGQLTEKEQDIALTEGDISKKYGNLDYTSPPDMLIPKSENTDIKIIEVITSTYTSKDIKAKNDYVKDLINEKKEVIDFEKTI